MTHPAEIMAETLFEQQHEIRYGCGGIDLWKNLGEVRRCDFIAEQHVVISALTAAGLAIRPVEPTDEMLFASPNVKNASELMKHAAILEARATYKAMIGEGK